MIKYPLDKLQLFECIRILWTKQKKKKKSKGRRPKEHACGIFWKWHYIKELNCWQPSYHEPSLLKVFQFNLVKMNAYKYHRGLFNLWEQLRKYGKISVAFSFSPLPARDAAELARCSYCRIFASLSFPTLPGATCSTPALYMQAGDLPKELAFWFVSFFHLLLSFGGVWYISAW